MELAVRWNQRSTPQDPTFLVVDVPGKTFKQCRIDSIKGRTVQWTELSKNTHVPQFRAFDWNFLHNVVAVGQWSGEVTILGLKNNSPQLAIPLKTHRACNSVAFSPESLLATGLERVRNDFCLNIYDIGQWASTPHNGLSRPSVNEPLRKLAVSEGIISIKFFLQEPNVLVTGVKGTGIRIYDLRDNQSSPVIQYSTSCVHNIAVDPCSKNVFASAGPPKDDTVHIWDRRSATKQSSNLSGYGASNHESMLELKHIFRTPSHADSPSIWSLRYSISQPGSLGVLSNHGNIKIFETKRDWNDAQRDASYHPDDAIQPLSVVRTETIESSLHLEKRTSKVHHSDQKILAFDFPNILESRGKSAAITLYSASEMELRTLHAKSPAIATRFTSRATIAVSDMKSRSSTGMQIYAAPQTGNISDMLLSVNRRLSSVGFGTLQESEDEETTNDGWAEDMPQPGKRLQEESRTSRKSRAAKGHILGTVQDALTIAERARRRCKEGYLLDPERNAEIVQGNRELELMWKWISIAKEHADSGSLSQGSINFSYLGVLNIWQNDIGADVSTRVRTGTNKGDIWKRIIEQVKDLDLPKIEIPETDRAYHRWLCLYVLGFDSRPEILLDTVKALALSGNNSEAALHALLARDPDLASKALRSGPRNTQNKALSLLLAVYAISEDRSSLLEQLDAIVGTEKDPFTQAISHLLATRIENREPSNLPLIPSLPPRYHIALAFSLLSDGPLRTYLFEQYKEAASSGLLSYIPLTGLSQLSLRVFKRYLVHSGDLQTVVLALSYVCPLFIDKPRMRDWRLEYRSNLNRYGLFIKRAQFDMQATKLATRMDGTTALEPQKRQISLKCSNCDSALHREPDRFVPGGNSGPDPLMQPLSEPPTIKAPPSLQSSNSDPTIPTTNINSSFETSNSFTTTSQTTSLSSNLTLPPITPSDPLRSAGLRTPTSPHGSIYSLNNPTTPSLITPTTTAGAATATTPISAQTRIFPVPRDGTLCPRCGARMPRCAVCEFWIGETDPRSRGARSATVTSVGTAATAETPTSRNARSSLITRASTDAINMSAAPTTAAAATAAATAAAAEKDGKGISRENGVENGQEDLLSGFVEICLKCRHVYHRNHAEVWFAKHTECAAVGCRCVCSGPNH